MQLVSVRRAFVALALFAVAAPLAAQPNNVLDNVAFRQIGPTRQSGRFVEFAVLESRPQVFYAATASGGVWKSDNFGVTLTEVFANQPIASVGAVALAQTNPDIVYVGSGEGNNSRSTYYGNGVYKTTDGGRTWANVGLAKSGHIARIAVHPTNPNIVFVAAVGNLYSENPDRGLYRTLDGGATWTKVLDHKVDGREIGAIDVQMDPSNPQVLYAATYDKVRRPWSFAEGGPGSGLWKSVDGGTKWTQLTGGLPTGMLGRIGITISHSDPKTLYAIIENVNATGVSADQRKARLAQGFGGNSIGDELFRSDDAGKTWRRVSGKGLLGRAQQVDAGDTTAVLARGGNAQANADTSAGRGGRAGAGRGAAGAAGRGGRAGTDTAAAAGRGGGGGGGGRGGTQFQGADPPYYYGQIRVDPKNKDHVYLLSVGVQHTQDGGQTWTSPFGFGGDNHALWIDPKDPDHMMLGYDHGMGVTFDGGRNWMHPENLPLAQFYSITYDNQRPYNVYGGIQDNGSVRGPSTKRGGGAINFEDWYNTGGGDGMYSAVDWKEGRWLYNESQFGAIQRRDQWTGQTQSIRYARPNPGGGRGGRGGGGRGAAAADTSGGGGDVCPASNDIRWNWASPIIVSSHNPDVVYHAGSVILRSANRGDSWTEISPDLSANEEAHRCGTGNVQYGTTTTLDESTIVPGLLWAGTDDGNVQVTKNGGGAWTNVRSKIGGHPGYWVTRVEAGHSDPGVAYVSVSGLRNDDFKPYLWKTADYGETWTSIASNLPNESVNVIREDRDNPNLLFVGTDLGLYASLDGGKSWGRMRTNLPTNPIHDLQIQPREKELIVGTHGRGMYIADISGLEGLTPQAMNADANLSPITPTVQWVNAPRTLAAGPNFNGESRPAGVAIHYYLKSSAAGNVTVRVFDGGRVIAEVSCPAAAGLQTVRWNMQARRDLTEAERAGAAGRGGAGRGGRGGGGGGAGGFGGGAAAGNPCAADTGRGGGRGGRGAGGGGGRGGGGGGAPTFPVAAGDAVMTTVEPGQYRVELTVGNNKYSQTATVLEDVWFKNQ